jgi:glycosyltransferase involved in cell wall biosynthesis
MSSPAFTVALAAYNEEDWVSSAIRSVLAQTREDFELVVVDDGSSDATVEVVRGFQTDPRMRLISQENKGLAGALNTAVAAGTAPYVSLIDADDLWMPTYLEDIGRALDDDPGAGFAYTDAWRYDHPTNRFWRVSANTHMGAPDPPPKDADEFLRLLIEANFVFGLATMRRSALDQVGGFNESLGACEDYEVWIRLLAHGYRAAYAPGRLAVVFNRVGSMSDDERSMFSYVREVCRIAAEDLDTSEEVKALARRRIARMDHNLAALDGEAKTTETWWALRRRLGTVRRAVFGSRFWYPGTPPDVAAAFPDLGRRDR